MKTTLASLMALALAGSAHAAVTNLSITQPDMSSALTISGTYVANDLAIDFEGLYTQSQLLLTLSSGTVYQDGVGSNTPPNVAFLPAFPTLAFDTFAANGSATAGGTYGEPSFSGGALNAGGGAAAQFDTAGINQTWFDASGAPNPTDLSGYLTGRITLSNDAVGEWTYWVSADDSPVTYEGTISGGVMQIIPEPASMALVGLGSLALIRRRVVTAGRS